MKKLLILLALFCIGCKKAPQIKPQSKPPIIEVVYKLGDTVKWINPANPNPGNPMIIKAIYDKTATNPEYLTLLDGLVYHTVPVSEVVIWRK